MVHSAAEGPRDTFSKILKKFFKITEFEFQNSGPSFFAHVCPVYCKKNPTQFEQN